MTGTAAGGSLLRINLSESDYWEGRPSTIPSRVSASGTG